MSEQPPRATTSDGTGPMLRVVRGDPEPEELAALVTVLTARAAHQETVSRPRSTWAARSRQARPPLRPGPDAWRLSTLPR